MAAAAGQQRLADYCITITGLLSALVDGTLGRESPQDAAACTQ
jgi:hypothetical protein